MTMTDINSYVPPEISEITFFCYQVIASSDFLENPIEGDEYNW